MAESINNQNDNYIEKLENGNWSDGQGYNLVVSNESGNTEIQFDTLYEPPVIDSNTNVMLVYSGSGDEISYDYNRALEGIRESGYNGNTLILTGNINSDFNQASQNDIMLVQEYVNKYGINPENVDICCFSRGINSAINTAKEMEKVYPDWNGTIVGVAPAGNGESFQIPPNLEDNELTRNKFLIVGSGGCGETFKDKYGSTHEIYSITNDEYNSLNGTQYGAHYNGNGLYNFFKQGGLAYISGEDKNFGDIYGIDMNISKNVNETIDEKVIPEENITDDKEENSEEEIVDEEKNIEDEEASNYNDYVGYNELLELLRKSKYLNLNSKLDEAKDLIRKLDDEYLKNGLDLMVNSLKSLYNILESISIDSFASTTLVPPYESELIYKILDNVYYLVDETLKAINTARDFSENINAHEIEEQEKAEELPSDSNMETSEGIVIVKPDEPIENKTTEEVPEKKEESNSNFYTEPLQYVKPSSAPSSSYNQGNTNNNFSNQSTPNQDNKYVNNTIDIFDKYEDVYTNDNRIVYDSGKNYKIIIYHDSQKIINVEQYYDFGTVDNASQQIEHIVNEYRNESFPDRLIQRGQYVKLVYKKEYFDNIPLNQFINQFNNLEEVKK